MKKLLFLLICGSIINILGVYSQDSGVQVETNIAGARVYVGDVLRGTTQLNQMTGTNLLRVVLTPGTHELRFEADGYATISERVQVETGFRTLRVSFETVSDRVQDTEDRVSRSRALTGRLNLLSVPSGAMIEINGNRVSARTDTQVETAVGEKRVRIFFPAGSLEIGFVLDPDEVLTVQADFDAGTITVDKQITLNFNANPSGGVLFFDGERVGTLPTSVTAPIRDRAYSYRIETPGFQTHTAELEARSNDIVRVDLMPISRSLSVRSEPAGGRVYLTTNAGRQFIGTTPLRYEIPMAGEYEVSAEKTDNGVRFESEPQSVTYGIDDRRKTISFQLSPVNATTVSGRTNSRYTPSNISVRFGNVSHNSLSSFRNVLIPAGRRTVRIGSARFVYDFIEGHSYTFEPLFPIPTNELIGPEDISNLTYQEIPPRPELRSETQPIYQPDVDFRFDGSGAGYGIFYGLVAAFSYGWYIEEQTGNVEDYVYWSLLAGPAVGAVIGGLIGGTEIGQRRVGEEAIPEAIAENRERMRVWNEERIRIEAENQSLADEVDDANATIRTENRAVRSANRERNVVIVRDTTANTSTQVPLSQ